MAILDAEYGTKVGQYVRAPSRSRQTKFLYAGLVICVLAVIALLTALCIVVARKVVSSIRYATIEFSPCMIWCLPNRQARVYRDHVVAFHRDQMQGRV